MVRLGSKSKGVTELFSSLGAVPTGRRLVLLLIADQRYRFILGGRQVVAEEAQPR